MQSSELRVRWRIKDGLGGGFLGKDVLRSKRLSTAVSCGILKSVSVESALVVVGINEVS